MGAAGVRLRAAAVCVAAVALAAPRAGAEPGTPVGGALLGTRGVAITRTAGVPPLPSVSASAFVVADVDTGEVLAARDPHGRYLPASTLKTLTAVSLIPQVELSTYYTPTYDDVNVEGSKVGLVAGTRVPVGKLVEAMLVVSGNDAANALASAAGGTRQSVATMNATATRLQANDTHADNPSGLDAPGQLTSAYDLALIARAGLAMPAFAKYAATLRDTMPAPRGTTFEIYNHNKLLPKYRGDIGIKTGFTVAARHTYVGAARRDGHTIVVTLLKAETLYPDATALLDWGFAAAGRITPVGRLVDPLPDVPVERADRSRVAPLAAPAQPAAVRKAGGTSVPTVPAAAAVVGVGAVVTLRRRAVRRRSGLRLDLPVR
jgi:D-alanyl-D-alanine carboxypeptidase (penicillin-binding protein 5/6)